MTVKSLSVKNLNGVGFDAQLFGIRTEEDGTFIVYGIPAPYEGYFIPLKYFTSFVDAMDYCNELNKQLYTRYIQRTNECNKELCLEHLKELTDLINELCV